MRKRSVLPIPSFAEEISFRAQGYRLIAGIDEAGCGALAGPLAAAAVILPPEPDISRLAHVRDSKLLNPDVRETLFQAIKAVAVSVGIGIIPHHVIDTDGLTKARWLAMKLAIAELSPLPECLLVDHFRIPDVTIPQKGITNGDRLCFSIACASIIAKVTRDRLMRELDKAYPGYALGKHKGYGTTEHLACLRRLGPCPVHRRSYLPVRSLFER